MVLRTFFICSLWLAPCPWWRCRTACSPPWCSYEVIILGMQLDSIHRCGHAASGPRIHHLVPASTSRSRRATIWSHSPFSRFATWSHPWPWRTSIPYPSSYSHAYPAPLCLCYLASMMWSDTDLSVSQESSCWGTGRYPWASHSVHLAARLSPTIRLPNSTIT